jgi:hypothetical protein
MGVVNCQLKMDGDYDGMNIIPGVTPVKRADYIVERYDKICKLWTEG